MQHSCQRRSSGLLRTLSATEITLAWHVTERRLSALTWRSGWSRRRTRRAEESSPRCPLCWCRSRSPPGTAPSPHFHQCRPETKTDGSMRGYSDMLMCGKLTPSQTDISIRTRAVLLESLAGKVDGGSRPETMTTVFARCNDFLLSGLLKALKCFPKQSFCGGRETLNPFSSVLLRGSSPEDLSMIQVKSQDNLVRF